jgi:hypothetical protein
MQTRQPWAQGQAERFVGYIGMFLMGAISWAGDHLRVESQPASATEPEHQNGQHQIIEE